MTAPPTIVWFRNDLRVDDHAPLRAAIARGGPVIPVFIWAPEDEGAWPLGAASRWWLHHSLAALARSLESRGSRLVVRTGPAARALDELVEETRAVAVVASDRVEPAARDCADDVARALESRGVEFELLENALLWRTREIRSGSGEPYRVYTPFARRLASLDPPSAPEPAPSVIAAPKAWPRSVPLADLRLLPTIGWDAGLRELWTPGERGATERFDAFVGGALADYEAARDRLADEGTSRLSPHLHFGEISVRRVWQALEGLTDARRRDGVAKFRAELCWREFSHHVLAHFPATERAPLRREFARFPWRDDPDALRAWQRGETGFPLVDAGMRQLWQTGWIHNRARMVVASFLVKHLLIPWQDGARWFWDTLVDADLANNTLGWQWSAGCGADAAPYFRIFNPTSQARKFDPRGEYIRRWVPQLDRMPGATAFEPHRAAPGVLETAGVELGSDYPKPIVQHDRARARALEALGRITGVTSRD